MIQQKKNLQTTDHRNELNKNVFNFLSPTFCHTSWIKGLTIIICDTDNKTGFSL